MSREGSHLPAGERPKASIEERPPFRLISGLLFRHSDTHAETSSDGGKTWTESGELMSMRGPIWALKGVVIQIENGPCRGRIVIPFYLLMRGKHPDYTEAERGAYAEWKGERILLQTHTHIPEMSGSFTVFSDDDGKTWNTSEGFVMGYFDDGHLGHWSCEEPVVAELKDGRLLCFMRSTTGRILKSYSEDGGESWSKVESTDIAMSNSPCALKRLPRTGDLVMVWNPMTADEICRGYRRGRLTIAVSSNDGITWEHCKLLDVSPGIGPVAWVTPGPVRAMVRGPLDVGEIPEGFRHYHYPEIYLDGDLINILYMVSTPEKAIRSKWRTFPIEWLYKDT
ncbi:sialidase family protein [Verrucomicrobiota bacterium]